MNKIYNKFVFFYLSLFSFTNKILLFMLINAIDVVKVLKTIINALQDAQIRINCTKCTDNFFYDSEKN